MNRAGWGVVVLAWACGGGDRAPAPPVQQPAAGFDPPVAINPESPINYPRQLYQEQIEGTVVLKLYVDERGTVVPESTRVAESSGYPALDSAALRGAPELRFAPARRDGRPVAASFLQPVHFRHHARPSDGSKP